eukprot:11422_1
MSYYQCDKQSAKQDYHSHITRLTLRIDKEDDEAIKYSLINQKKDLEEAYKIERAQQYAQHKSYTDYHHPTNNRSNHHKSSNTNHRSHRNRKKMLFADAPSAPLDFGESLGIFYCAEKPQTSEHSNWKQNYCCNGPNTPSSGSDAEDTACNYNAIHPDRAMIQNDIKMNDHAAPTQSENELLPWMKRINGLHIRPEPVGYTHNKSLAVYNQLTGGKCYEIEQESKHKTAHQNRIKHEFGSYLQHIHKRIFYLNDASIYEIILMFLDAKSILNGFMITCKKMHYFKFMDESLIWHQLLLRDYPRLFDDKAYRLLVPYMNSNSFEQQILDRTEEKRLYFTKIKHDKWWKLLFNLKGLEQDIDAMGHEMIKTQWNGFTWSELLLGKDDDNGLNAYKQLTKLRCNAYVKAFGNATLSDNEQIEYFCNAIRKHMPSGKAIFYLNPWIPSNKTICWTRTNKQILWCKKYAQCYALAPPEDEYRIAIVKIPQFIQLMGTMEFRQGKGFKPRPDWLSFLQSFDPNVCRVTDVKTGWFQKQFMLNEMEIRLKNIRTLIEIVRS